MQVDWYTKAVPTVIAAALSAIAIQNATGAAAAQVRGQPQKVAICSEDGARCAHIDRSDRLSVTTQ